LWIMLRDEIDYEEFCRRGKLRQKGEAHAGMPDYNSGPAQAVPGQLNRLPASPKGGEFA